MIYSKRAEYTRSAVLFKEIIKRDGAYFGLAFIMDSGYNNKDMQIICKILLEQEKLGKKEVILIK